MLDPAARQMLLALARESLRTALEHGTLAAFPWREYPDALLAWRSTFVTLSSAGQLRGCCGRLEADRTLVEDVWENAFASGFRDPRFDALRPYEWQQVRIEISVLSAPEKLDVRSTHDLLTALVPQRHGLILGRGPERVTFIPHVWDSLPDPASFLRHLREKAGWPAEGWESDLEAWRFEAESF